jgi:hypothetical protein
MSQWQKFTPKRSYGEIGSQRDLDVRLALFITLEGTNQGLKKTSLIPLEGCTPIRPHLLKVPPPQHCHTGDQVVFST